MVEECGAKFEKLKVSDCTHLITTRAYVRNGNKKGQLPFIRNAGFVWAYIFL